jgi:internalin A
MNEGLASQLIKKNLEERNPYLDLGNCGLSNLEDIPELFDCVHLETLILSSEWYEFEKGKPKRKKNTRISRNTNIFITLSPEYKRLKNLKTFFCAGDRDNKWQITDITVLKDLKNLTKLLYCE